MKVRNFSFEEGTKIKFKILELVLVHHYGIKIGNVRLIVSAIAEYQHRTNIIL